MSIGWPLLSSSHRHRPRMSCSLWTDALWSFFGFWCVCWLIPRYLVVLPVTSRGERRLKRSSEKRTVNFSTGPKQVWKVLATCAGTPPDRQLLSVGWNCCSTQPPQLPDQLIRPRFKVWIMVRSPKGPKVPRRCIQEFLLPCLPCGGGCLCLHFSCSDNGSLYGGQ